MNKSKSFIKNTIEDLRDERNPLCDDAVSIILDLQSRIEDCELELEDIKDELKERNFYRF